ncbi:MAG: amidohydrolase family protein [Acidimicrobiales bacterium]
MTTRPARIVDAHVHLWDPAHTDWYPYLAGQMDIGMDNVKGMARAFDVATYHSEAAGWNVEKLVNVAAATGRHSLAETMEMERRAEADALIGGLWPTDTVAESIAGIEQQMAASRFRGVRPMGAHDGPLPAPDVLRALQERDLVFEILARPDQLAAAASGLAGHEDLVVVVEHVGWPRSTADDERALWQAGMDALAAAGPNVHCKLSGLAMPVGSMDAAAFAPWLEPVIERFGVDRCFFASNFPVDGLHGTLDELWSAYAAVTTALDDGSRDRLFATNAERVYRI